MNTVVTSREAILKKSQEILLRDGYAALSIRAVAAACRVSVGSIYNYFDSKADLLGATIEEIWGEIFHHSQPPVILWDTQKYISWMYECLEYGNQRFPGFFAFHSLGFLGDEKLNGKKRMYQTWQHILSGLRHALEHDPKIRPNAFDSNFTPEKYARMIFSVFLSDTMMQKEYDPEIILEVIRRTLY